MSVAPLRLERPPAVLSRASDAPRLEHRDGGDWPHTSRVVPWMLAVFLVMLWLVPFDAVGLPVHLPFDSALDRVVLGLTALIWLAGFAAPGLAGPRHRPSLINLAVATFLCVALVSVVVNLGFLSRLDELDLAVKKVSLLLSYLLFFYIVATSIRPGEVRSFVKLLVGLAAITAFGTLWEYRTDFNAFYAWTAALAPHGFTVEPHWAGPAFERANITGPTRHGLAIATVLGMVLPFAIAQLMQSRNRRERVLYALAAGLLLAGAVATLRKTSIVVPAVALVVLTAYRPGAMFRLLPLGVALLLCISIAAPGAMGSIVKSLTGGVFQLNSSKDRSKDYSAVAPDVQARPFLGRGYGAYEPQRGRYRVLDNQLLGILLTTGYLGVAAYLGMILATFFVCHAAIQSRDPARAPPALAATASAVAFGVANLLFDALAYPQVPYLFFFIIGLAVVVATRQESPATRRAKIWLASRAGRRPAAVPAPTDPAAS